MSRGVLPERHGRFLFAAERLSGRNRLHRALTDAEMLGEIGRDLRAFYRNLLDQPLPDHLMILVRKLERTAH